MRLYKSAFIALVALPLVACGAAPDGAMNDGASVAEAATLAPGAQPRIIDFDQDRFGSAVTDGEDITAVYTLSGITFSCAGCASGSVFARSPGRIGNGVSPRLKVFANYTGPEFDATRGVVKATFTKPASVVTIDALGLRDVIDQNASPFIAPEGAPWLVALDASGDEIAEADYSAPLGQWQTLTVSAGGVYEIASVEFSSSTTKAFPFAMMARFDNLTFDQAPIAKQPPVKPPTLQ